MVITLEKYLDLLAELEKITNEVEEDGEEKQKVTSSDETTETPVSMTLIEELLFNVLEKHRDLGTLPSYEETQVIIALDQLNRSYQK